MLGWGCYPLVCRCGRVCVGRVVILLVILCMFASCIELVCGVIVTCCLDCVLAFVVSYLIKLLSLSPSCLLTSKTKNENKKKNFFACCRNDGVVTSYKFQGLCVKGKIHYKS
jgi:hypothetical protein